MGHQSISPTNGAYLIPRGFARGDELISGKSMRYEMVERGWMDFPHTIAMRFKFLYMSGDGR